MASGRHKAIISNAATFFRKQGYKVMTGLLPINGRNAQPDLIIQRMDGSIFPFECGTIVPDLPHLYFLHFGGYYHANKFGKINMITTEGKSPIIGHVSCRQEIRKLNCQQRKLRHQPVAPIKSFKSIRGTPGYHQYGHDFLKQVRVVRNAYPKEKAAEVFSIAFDNCKIISYWLTKQED